MFAYLYSNLFIDLGFAVSRSKVMAQLPNLVSYVIKVASKEKVVRIDACPNVALMTDPHSFRDRANV